MDGSAAYDARQKYIEELMQICEEMRYARLQHRYSGYYDLVVSFYTSLQPRLTDKEREQCDLVWDQCEKIVSEYNYHKEKRIPFLKYKIKPLIQWEQLLRRFQNAKGLLVPNKKGGGTALGRGTG